MATGTVQAFQPGSKIDHVSDVVKPPFEARALQVYVWRNSTTALGFLPDANHPGHSAMQLYEGGKVVRLISWWPKDDAGKNNMNARLGGKAGTRLSIDALSEMGSNARELLQTAKLKGNLGQVARQGQYLHRQGDLAEYSRELAQQKARWLKVPDFSVSIPGMGAENLRWGLHLPGIADWWSAWNSDPERKYIMQSRSNNCSGVVAGALKAGGAAWFLPDDVAGLLPQLITKTCTPNFVADWAERLAHAISNLEQNTRSLQDAIVKAGPGLAPIHLPAPLPNKGEWIKATTRAHKPRSFELQAIDRALDGIFTETFSEDQQKRLVVLVKALSNHISKRPASERRLLVLSLARQALGLVGKINHRVRPVTPLKQNRPPAHPTPSMRSLNRTSFSDDDGDWNPNEGAYDEDE
jgi:hypothetical protein